jgi:hypothetical protein
MGWDGDLVGAGADVFVLDCSCTREGGHLDLALRSGQIRPWAFGTEGFRAGPGVGPCHA